MATRRLVGQVHVQRLQFVIKPAVERPDLHESQKPLEVAFEAALLAVGAHVLNHVLELPFALGPPTNLHDSLFPLGHDLSLIHI